MFLVYTRNMTFSRDILSSICYPTVFSPLVHSYHSHNVTNAPKINFYFHPVTNAPKINFYFHPTNFIVSSTKIPQAAFLPTKTRNKEKRTKKETAAAGNVGERNCDLYLVLFHSFSPFWFSLRPHGFFSPCP